MTRKKEIQEAAEHYQQVDATNLACNYGWEEPDIQQQCFKAGVKWADQHPREGLWDAEKVEKVLGNLLFNKEEKIYRAYLDYDAFFEDLRKAMED